MKIIITLALSACFIAISSGTTAGGLMKAIGFNDKTPKPLINVVTIDRAANTPHIRELHGDVSPRPVMTAALKRQQRLMKFKAKLRKQKLERLSGVSHATFTAAY